MNTTLFRPLPLPPEGVRPGVGLLVLALHLVLLWMANLYWPLHTVLLGAVQNTAQSVTVQIFQKTTEASKPGDSDSVSAKQAITNPGAQRFGRSEVMLALPPAQSDSSTPLAGTAQSVQSAPQRTVVAAQPKADTFVAVPASSSAQVRPVPKVETPIATAPKPVTQAVVRSVDEVLPAPAPTQPAANTLPPPSATAAPLPALPALPSVPLTPPLPAAASALPAPPVSVVPVAPAFVEAAVISPNTYTFAVPAVPSNAPVASSVSSAGTASGAAQASSAGSTATGSPQGNGAAPATPSTNAGAPLILNLPPNYIYRPPISLPRRSLADMANDQLRRKPRDAFADGIQSAGNIDCFKDAPDGAAQGLLAIGPLLKRAIEEKCRK